MASTLPPRDATKELADPPYELVRLLGETPLPPVPPIPGTIGLDISELNLRAVSLRDLRLDAATDGTGWTIKNFAARLPGSASFIAPSFIVFDRGSSTATMRDEPTLRRSASSETAIAVG